MEHALARGRGGASRVAGVVKDWLDILRNGLMMHHLILNGVIRQTKHPLKKI
jgi:hypothetical protein